VREVLLCGEGPNELGRGGPEPHAGVLEALLAALGLHVSVVERLPWKKVPHYRAGGHASREERLVRGAALRAKDRGAALVFVRDRDGDEARESAIERALTQGDAPVVVGGVAIEQLESWLLAIAGERSTEQHGRARTFELVRQHAQPKSTVAYVALVERHGLSRVAPDAASLHRWLERAREALAERDA
jgi:hypothetical protein